MAEKAKKEADPASLSMDVLAYPLAGLLAVLVFAVSMAVTWRGGIDDAYITYVFAENVAEGHGFVWNARGPHVYGSSSLVYALLLALLGYLGLDIPTASIVVGGLSWAGAYLVLFHLLKGRLGPLWGLLVVALGAATVPPVLQSQGMETGFYVFLIFSVFALYAAGRPTLALLLGVVLVLTRLDGALAPVLVLAHYLLTSGEDRLAKTLKVAWPSAVAIAMSSVALTWYFGGPLPSSFIAKTTFDESVSGSFMPAHYLELLPDPLGSQPLSVTFLVVGAVGVARALVGWRDHGSLVVLWLPAYVAMFYLSGMPHQGWYYVPAIPVLYAAFAWGGSWPWKYVSGQGRTAPLRYLLIPLTIVLVLLAAATFWSNAEYSYRRYSNDPFGEKKATQDPRHQLARAVVADMEGRGMERAEVVAYEVGYMGYLIPGRVHDILGLVSPDALERGGYKNPLYLVETYDPDYVVIVENPFYPPTAPILNSGLLRTEYEPVYSTPAYGTEYTVFAKSGE